MHVSFWALCHLVTVKKMGRLCTMWCFIAVYYQRKVVLAGKWHYSWGCSGPAVCSHCHLSLSSCSACTRASDWLLLLTMLTTSRSPPDHVLQLVPESKPETRWRTGRRRVWWLSAPSPLAVGPGAKIWSNPAPRYVACTGRLHGPRPWPAISLCLPHMLHSWLALQSHGWRLWVGIQQGCKVGMHESVLDSPSKSVLTILSNSQHIYIHTHFFIGTQSQSIYPTTCYQI